MLLIDHLARYIRQLTYDDLPSNVIEQAKWVLVDAIGAGISGCNTPWCRAVYETCRRQGGAAEATLIAYGDHLPAANAAMVNGMFIQGIDYNDELSGIHTGAIVPPTALAVGEACGACGREILTSVAIGYDVAGRLAEAADAQGMFERGYQPSAVLGGFAAAATAARLYGLNQHQTVNALGIAGSYAGGTIEFLQTGSDTKRFNIAKAAYTGVMAAGLAQGGLTGPPGIFEGKFGLLRLMTANAKPPKLIEALGARFDILQTLFKKYPVCDGAFCPLEAALAIVSENHLAINQIQRIHFKIKSFLVPFLADYKGGDSRKYHPRNVTDAQFCLPFIVALGLYNNGVIRIADFNSAIFDDRRILDLARKVSVEADTELDKTGFRPMTMPAIATLATKDGHRYTRRVDFPHGDPRNAFTGVDHKAKFRGNSSGQLEHGQMTAILDIIVNLEALIDISPLMRLLAWKSRGSSHKEIT